MADQRATGERPVPTHEPAGGEQDGTRRRGWAVTVVAASMVAVLLAASLAGFRFVLSDPLPPSPRSPVIAVEHDEGRPWPTAQVVGTLRLRDGCLVVDDAVALFPAGTTWSAPGAVVFPDGTTWSLGERVVGAGGLIPAPVDTDLGERATAATAACAADLGGADVVQVRP